MAAMTMDREPEMARFIDTYKFDQDMSNKRDRFGGGTSLPLNSDGYEDKQRALREERHRDWMVQQDKQKQTEQEKLMNRHRSPPRPAQPQGPQVDYNLQGEQARAEEKRAYQDYMKAKEERYWQMRGRPVTPPGGLNIGAYDKQLKETAAAKKKEYKEMLDQQKFEQHKLRALDRVADVSPKYVSYRENERPLVGSPRDVNYYMQEKLEKDKFRKDLRKSPQRDFSPPGKNQVADLTTVTEDANYKAYLEVEKDKAYNKRKYAEELLQQQKEHMYLRARQEPEMAVIDRNAPQQYLANKPPPGPGYRPREENEERRRMEEEKHYQQASKPAQVVKNQYYSSDDYEKFQKEIAKEQSKEYQEFLAKQYQPPTDAQGLPLGQYRYEPKRLAMEKERNKEYNQLLEKKYGKGHSRSSRSEPDRDWTSFYYGNDNFHEEKRKMLDDERKNEYNQFVKEQKQKHPDRRNDYNGDVSGGPYSGLFQGLGDHGNKSDLLNQERKREYNEQYAGKEKMTGRPNWARETLPNNSDRGRSSPMKSQPPTDQYQQMLDEKRREEAGRRRYDDPEYQGRLAESRERERGEAGPRYGGY